MRASRGMGALKSGKKPGKKAVRRKPIKVEEKQRPPKKPSALRLGPPLRDFKPRNWPKELD